MEHEGGTMQQPGKCLDMGALRKCQGWRGDEPLPLDVEMRGSVNPNRLQKVRRKWSNDEIGSN